MSKDFMEGDKYVEKYEKKIEERTVHMKMMNFDCYLAEIFAKDLGEFAKCKGNVHGKTKKMKKDLLKAHKIFKRYCKNADEVSQEETDLAFDLVKEHFHRCWL
jgi:site-specific DNA-adenine methylase